MGARILGMHRRVDERASSPDRAASPSALRIAVTGRQKLYVYLASNTAISASSMAIAASAKSARVVAQRCGRATATERATGQ